MKLYWRYKKAGKWTWKPADQDLRIQPEGEEVELLTRRPDQVEKYLEEEE